MFTAGAPMTSQDSRGITVFAARDTYEEAEYTAAEIRRLVTEEGYRYREITIVSRSPERYAWLPGRRPKEAGDPLFCVPAGTGGRGTGDPSGAGGVSGGAVRVPDGEPVGAAENGGVGVFHRGDLRSGKLRLFVAAHRPGLAAGVCPSSPRVRAGADPGGRPGASAAQ